MHERTWRTMPAIPGRDAAAEPAQRPRGSTAIRTSGHRFADIAVTSELVPIQRAVLTLNQKDNPRTPAQTVTTELGIRKKDLNADIGELGNMVRASKATAQITKKTIRDSARKKDAALSKIGAMGRAEVLMKQGAKWSKFYDAGHLVGDQLVGGSANTFQLANLAPQVSGFNTGPYLDLENKVKAAVLAGRDTGKATLTAQVGYEKNSYKRSGRLLAGNGVIDATQLPDSSYKVGNKLIKQADFDKSFDVATRIPRTWSASVSMTDLPDIDMTQMGTDLTTRDEEYGVGARRGSPFKARVDNGALKVDQYGPSDQNVRPADVVSIVANTFKQLDTAQKIVAKLKELPQAFRTVPNLNVSPSKQRSPLSFDTPAKTPSRPKTQEKVTVNTPTPQSSPATSTPFTSRQTANRPVVRTMPTLREKKGKK